MLLRDRFDAAESFRAFIDGAQKHAELWATQARLARVSPDAVARVRRLGRRWSFLVLNEDWCGDAVNTIPFVARLADEAGIELRSLGRDANPDLMDAHLTGTSRSIPVVMVLDRDLVERGWWGPRPSELQRWVLTQGLTLDSVSRYREIRRWYARDRGVTTVNEIVELLERIVAVEEADAA